jgi:hypothetical protein
LPSRCPRGELPPYSSRGRQYELARSTSPPGIRAPSCLLPSKPAHAHRSWTSSDGEARPHPRRSSSSPDGELNRVRLPPAYLLASLPDTAAPRRRRRQTCSPPACLLVQEEAGPACPRRSRACSRPACLLVQEEAEQLVQEGIRACSPLHTPAC